METYTLLLDKKVQHKALKKKISTFKVIAK